AGMKRSSAAEGDHRALADVLAALDGMDARRIGHVLLDDLGDAGRGPDALELEQRPDRRLQSLSGGCLIESDLAAGTEGGIDLAEDDIGVGDRRLGSAAAIADGSGRRSRAVGPDRDTAELVDPRDRAAAGANLDHLDYRNAHRQPRALHVAI